MEVLVLYSTVSEYKYKILLCKYSFGRTPIDIDIIAANGASSAELLPQIQASCLTIYSSIFGIYYYFSPLTCAAQGT